MVNTAWWALFVVLATQSPEPAPSDHGCEWSAVWPSIAQSGPSGGKFIPPRRRKGKLERPHPNPGEGYDLDGPWILSAVVDAKGKVIDAKIVRSASNAPWPRYEAALLKSFRKWEFAPATRDGQPVPFCFTLRATDRGTY